MLPLVILGVVSIVGGLSGLRLPETLHHRLPQTVEEGEEFGKDWTLAECLRCIPVRHVSSCFNGKCYMFWQRDMPVYKMHNDSGQWNYKSFSFDTVTCFSYDCYALRRHLSLKFFIS